MIARNIHLLLTRETNKQQKKLYDDFLLIFPQ